MSSFKGIISREVIGKNVIVQTAHHFRVFPLRSWNLHGYKAAEIGNARTREVAHELAAIMQ